MLKPGDFVVPTPSIRGSNLTNYFHAKNQAFGIVLHVKNPDVHNREYVILCLYANPYAHGLQPTYTWLTSSFYKIDSGVCRTALENFIRVSTPSNSNKVYALAERYDRLRVKVKERDLQRVSSFEEGMLVNAHLAHNQMSQSYVTFDRFMASRTKHLKELVALQPFQPLSIPFLRL